MENLITGTVVDTFVDKTTGKDGKEYSKRYVSLLHDDNSICQFQISWKCKVENEVSLGQKLCAKWVLSQFGKEQKKYTSVEIIDYEVLSGIRQGSEPLPEQKIPDPEGPTVPAGGVQESDFNFTDNGEQIPF